jgi:hypothetical protein
MSDVDSGAPRVLLVNVALAGDDSGTGQTLKNLFDGFPQGSLMQLSLQLRPDAPRTTIENTVFIDADCIRAYSRVRGLADRLGGRIGQSAGEPRGVTPPNSVRQLSTKGRIRTTVSSYLDMLPCVLTQEISAHVSKFAPTVIYTAGSSIRVHAVANGLAESLGIPIVLHLMDDWPQTVYTSTVGSRLPRGVLLRELARTNVLSHSNLAISEPLCEKYSARYGKVYQPLMNPAMNIRRSAIAQNHAVIDLVYAGSIGLGRQDSLLQIAHVIAEMNSPVERAHLSLFIPDAQNAPSIRAPFEAVGCSVLGYMPNPELQKRYDQADVLVHVESFGREYCDFTRLSLSTKVPEYMGVGKPLLAFLPHELYGSAYLRSRDCAVVVNNPEQLRHGIGRLVEDFTLRQRLGENGLEAARTEHSTEAVRERLASTLVAASRAGRHYGTQGFLRVDS